MLSTERIENARSQALQFFNADPERFDLVFVPNATAAIKMVAEGMRAFSDASDQPFSYLYHSDAHTSLVGVRELANGGVHCFTSDDQVNAWIDDGMPSFATPGQKHPSVTNVQLFAYPAQSNMNGRRLPLDWGSKIKSIMDQSHTRVYTLLDAAAFVATAPLNLGDCKVAPDFVALSFYKIFGQPDLGALLVRKDAGHVLRSRRYFGGGTVDMVINGQQPWHAIKETSLHEALEDGTPAFHNMVALGIAFDVHEKLFGSMENVSQHTSSLAKDLYQRMSSLAHANGKAVCQLHKGVKATYGDSRSQGPTIAFNIQNSSGAWIGKSDFEALAVVNNIQLRTGGVCNPGGIAQALHLSPKEMKANYKQGLRCGNEVDTMNGKPTGIIRVSFGAMSSTKDITNFVNFLHMFVDTKCNAIAQANTSENDDIIGGTATCAATTTPCQIAETISLKEIATDESSKTFTSDVKEMAILCPVPACGNILRDKAEKDAHYQGHKTITGSCTHASPELGGDKAKAKSWTVKAKAVFRRVLCLGG